MKDLKKIQEFFSKPLEEVKTDEYGNHIEPQFKIGDKVKYLGHPGEVVNVESRFGRYTYNVAYDKGQGRTKVSNISNKGGELKLAENTLEENHQGKTEEELRSYIKGLMKDRSSAASKGQDGLVSGINKEIQQLAKELKKRQTTITEAKNMTLGNYLDDLDRRFVDLMRAADGKNAKGSQRIDMLATINHNFNLFRNYISSIKKEYSSELNKELTFSIDESKYKGNIAGDAYSSFKESVNEQADHVSPMVVKAYKEYLQAKKETAVDMAKKQLDALGVKYELGNEFKPFKVIYKPTGQSDEFYDTFEDIVDLFNLKGVVKSSMGEAKFMSGMLSGKDFINAKLKNYPKAKAKVNQLIDMIGESKFTIEMAEWIFDFFNNAHFESPMNESKEESLYKNWDQFEKPSKIKVYLNNGKTLEITPLKLKGGKRVYDAILQAFIDDRFDITNKVIQGMTNNLSEAKEEDKVDTITMDVPLFIRMLEYSREDAAEDMDLHDVTEKAISLGKERGILQMDDYDEIIGAAEEIKEAVNLKQSKLSSAEYQQAKKLKDFKASDWKWNASEDLYTKVVNEAELSEASVPSNIKSFAKRKGVTALVNKVAGWAEKVGARISGGTAIGYNYSTLVLDMKYQAGEIRINTDNDIIKLYNTPVNSLAQFKKVYDEKNPKQDLEEGMGGQLDEKYFIEVSVRDARKALSIFDDQFRNADIEMYGSNVYASNDFGDIYDLYNSLKAQDIEISDSTDFDQDPDNDNLYENVAQKVINKIKEAKPGLWANINAKQKRGEKPAHGNSDAYKSAVKAGKKINSMKEGVEDNGEEEKAFDSDLIAAANGIASTLGKELKAKQGDKEQLDEAIVTSAIAAVLTGNALIGFISKMTAKLMKKLNYKKGEDIAEKIHHWAHDNETAFQTPIKRVLAFFIKDKQKLDITTKAIYAIVIAGMAAGYGADAVSSLGKADWFKSALASLKILAKSDEAIINAYPAIKSLMV
jgi:hypothetical protein